MSRWLWLAVIPVVIAAAYFALLFMVQRSMLFPMPPPMPGEPDKRAEVVRVKADGGEAYGLFLRSQASGPAALMMFMHGNGELADYWIDEFDVPRSWGFGILLVEYPGYGGAPGSPSEKSITEATRALYDWAATDPRVDAKRIVAYGRSLGGGAAVRLALERPVAALILESAFTSVADFAARFMAPPFLIRDPFDNRKTLASYRGPLLVIHGRLDTIVPFEHGRELASIVPGAQFRELNCGHNDCPRDWRTIASFLAGAKVVRILS
ncbi:MAG TPA: alpha/beta hydrolase [Vicinamibacterales bacterium]|nr:alpha/beta hydrolase [Vicinamibacterales bacterium]